MTDTSTRTLTLRLWRSYVRQHGKGIALALGCTLAFALAGRFVHEGETVPQVITSHLHPPDWEKEAFFAELPDAWRTWLQSLLSAERDRRPDAASALKVLMGF